MGQFSWLAVDTNEQIFNDRPEGYQTVSMVFINPDGNQVTVTESDYEGYGIFGGYDYYQVLAFMNGLNGEDDVISDNNIRDAGINLYFSGKCKYFPQLYLQGVPEKVDFTNEVKTDPDQGWTTENDDDNYTEEEDSETVWGIMQGDGNAFAVMGRVSLALRNKGWSREQEKAYKDEAMSGDYDHLLQVSMGVLSEAGYE